MTPRRLNSVVLSPSKSAGVTLIELMVVIAILAVIAALAYPAYADYVRESRRTAAQAEIIELAGKQEQFFLNNKTYSDDPISDGLRAQQNTQDGTYLITIVSVAGCTLPNCYIIEATPQAGQAEDRCGTLSMTSDGDVDPNNCW